MPKFEEYTGLKIDLRWVARKVWKSYFALVTGLAVFFSPTPTLTQARPPEVDPHVPSASENKTATLEGSTLYHVSLKTVGSSGRLDVVRGPGGEWVYVFPVGEGKKKTLPTTPPPPPTSSRPSIGS